MHLRDTRLIASPTDLANFLACRHKSALDFLAATGALDKPHWSDPFVDVLRDRGDAHEAAYVASLRAQGLRVLDLKPMDRPAAERALKTALREGVDVIVQAPLATDGWAGVADVLRKIPRRSGLGNWSYEVHDTKLSRETRGGTILQLCVYSELLGALQGIVPEQFSVVTPASTEVFRFDDFAAFYRQAKSRFVTEIPKTELSRLGVPDRVEHCGVCRWSGRCEKARRDVDHLTFVAGLGRQHQIELEGQGIQTLGALATIPVPLQFKPRRGTADTYERLHHQARLQLETRNSGTAKYELLPIDPEFGLTQLPEPRPGDLFLDLEGDPFAGSLTDGAGIAGGREYLIGLGKFAPDHSFIYVARWGLSAADERAAFEAVMDEIMAALDADPAIHIYHYAPYEPAAFKRLMGRYATREADVDRLLRGRRFVDLYGIARRTLRAGIEHYSIKDLEPFYAFTRTLDLKRAGLQRRVVELALETNDLSALTPEIRADVERYNADDCRSTLELRHWLEELRRKEIKGGQAIVRPPLDPVDPSEQVSERQQRIEDLRRRLLARGAEELGLPMTDVVPSTSPWHVLAYLLDWQYREDKVAWWEYFRLIELPDEDLFDERSAVAGLEFVERVEIVKRKDNGKPTGSVIDRYRYPPQEIEIRSGGKLRLRDETTFGDVVGTDRLARTLDIKKGKAVVDTHPPSAIVQEGVPPDTPAVAVFRFATEVAANGFDAVSNRAGTDLLLRRPPRLPVRSGDESTTVFAVRVIGDLGGATLPIQGPPGSGKTFTGARMICELVRRGKRVGVTGPSHKVIRNLLDAVAGAASETGQRVRLGQKVSDDRDGADDITDVAAFDTNEKALDAIEHDSVDVLGGTAWLWSRDEFDQSVDVLFVDEAGQMSLANTLAASQAAPTLVLLGDPRQLEQPQKGSHPPGVDVSALDHILQGQQTMPEDRGLFLPVTWRLAPNICHFTSEVFYESKLTSKPGLERQRLEGTGRFDGAGLFTVDVAHEGCRNSSDAEVEIVADIVAQLRQAGAAWFDEKDQKRPIEITDILIVGPYNAHVTRLQERLAGHRVGTVDKFQGQEAPVVIYSMATSSADDAPRGMEFLYSLNRLNVATSRAKCACIVVASPRLFEPECQSPQQMRLANALARYRELSRPVFMTR